jgi:hypothetical protein
MDKDWRWDDRQLQIVDPRLRFDVNILDLNSFYTRYVTNGD